MIRLLFAAVVAVGVSGCGERAAKVHTPTATAEVTTSLPEEQVSKEQLESAAANAAVAASVPGDNTVLPDPVPASNTLIEVKP